jgi:hypothetical protein
MRRIYFLYLFTFNGSFFCDWRYKKEIFKHENIFNNEISKIKAAFDNNNKMYSFVKQKIDHFVIMNQYDFKKLQKNMKNSCQKWSPKREKSILWNLDLKG